MVLTLTKAGAGADLSIEWWPADLGDDPDAVRDAIKSRVLLTNAADLRLAYFGGLTYEETALELALPLGTLKSRIRSALKKLASEIADDSFSNRVDAS